MFDRLAALVSRHWVLVMLAWAVLVVMIPRLAPRWDDVTKDGDFAYLPEAMTSVQGERLLEAAFPESLSRSQGILVVCRPRGPLQKPDLAIADRLVELLSPTGEDGGPILAVLSHQTEVVGEKLVSPVGPDGQALLIILQLRSEFMAIANMELLGRIQQTLDAVRRASDFPPGLQLGLTGSAAVGADMLFSAEESIRNTERTTIALVVLILLAVYRAPGLVIVPLVTIFVSLTVALGLVAWIAQGCDAIGWLDYKIFKTTRIFIVVVLFGATTDFCLFLIARYKEEIRGGLAPAEALAQALGRVGGAVAASAMTTILGLGAMVFCGFGKFRNSGPTIALCLAVGLGASLTLAPAMLRAGGRLVFWPLGVRRPRGPSGEQERAREDPDAGAPAFRGFWERLSRQIVRRPGLILVASLLVMLPLAVHGLGVEVTYDLLSELRPQRPSVQGTELLRRHFPAGETGPMILLAFREAGGLDASDSARQRISRLSQSLYGLEYEDSQGRVLRPVTSVRSLVEPLGEQPQKFGVVSGFRKGILRGHPRTKSTYLAHSPGYEGRLTRLDLVTQFDPFSAESIRFLDHLERSLRELGEDPRSEWGGTEFHFVGTTAGIRDLKSITTRDLILIQLLVPIAVLAVLVLLLRRLWVSLYLIATVLLGYFVSMGVSELFFAWLYGETFVGLDWKVPMYLFVILIAVGEDYNIYLAARVFEEQRQRGPLEGLRAALVRTGGIITSCGVIMAGTFASMTTGTLRATSELGFALAFGVMLDTCIIRTILVPAFLVLREKVWGEGRSGDKPYTRKT